MEEAMLGINSGLYHKFLGRVEGLSEVYDRDKQDFTTCTRVDFSRKNECSSKQHLEDLYNITIKHGLKKAVSYDIRCTTDDLLDLICGIHNFLDSSFRLSQ